MEVEKTAVKEHMRMKDQMRVKDQRDRDCDRRDREEGRKDARKDAARNNMTLYMLMAPQARRRAGCAGIENPA